MQVLAEGAVGGSDGIPGGEQTEHLLPHRLLCRHPRPLHREIHA